MNVKPWERGHAELRAALNHLRRAAKHLSADKSGMNEELLLLDQRLEALADKAKDIADFKTHQIRLQEIRKEKE